MGFADLTRADFDFIAGIDAEHGETIEYQEETEAGAQPWRSLRAIVERGDPGVPLDLGSLGRRGPAPVQVSISKNPTTGVVLVRERKDRIKLQPGTSTERIYQVVAILDAGDPAIWRIHAVA